MLRFNGTWNGHLVNEEEILAWSKLPQTILTLSAPLYLPANPQTPLLLHNQTVAEVAPALLPANVLLCPSLTSASLKKLIEARLARACYVCPPSAFRSEAFPVDELYIFLVPRDLPGLQSKLLGALTSQSHRLPERRAGNHQKHFRALLRSISVPSVPFTKKGADEEEQLIASCATMAPLLDLSNPPSLIDCWNRIPKPDEQAAPSELEATYPWFTSTYNAIGEVGIKQSTELLAYQKKAAQTMLYREYARRKNPDLTCTSHMDAMSRPFHLKHRPDSIEVLSERPTYDAVTGGILTDKAGSGKTLTVLSLVAATKNRLAIVDDEATHEQLFQYQPYTYLLGGLGASGNYECSNTRADPTYKAPKGVASLFDICTIMAKLENLRQPHHHMLLSPAADKPRENEALTNALVELPVYYDRPNPADVLPAHSKSTRATLARPGITKDQTINDFNCTPFRVTKTTLVIVLPNLVNHWAHEIEKHISKAKRTVSPDIYAEPMVWDQQFRYQVVAQKKEAVEMTAPQIAKNDLVIVSKAVLQHLTAVGHVHFVRLVVDEGDYASGTSNIKVLLAGLRSHAMWLITATPTTNLNSSHMEALVLDGSLLKEEQETLAVPSTSDQLKGDLTKLERLAVFLRMRPFWKSDFTLKDPDSDLFERFVRAFAKDHSGSHVIQEVLNQLVIQTPPAMINRETAIPKQTVKLVEISWAQYDRLVYEAILCFFAANALLSQKLGQDYLFDKRNRKVLQNFVINLRHAHVSYGSDELYAAVLHVEEAVKEKIANETAKTDDQLPEEYLAKLRQLQRKLEFLLSQPHFQQLCSSGELWYRLRSTAPDLISPYLAVPNAFPPQYDLTKDHLIEDHRVWHILADGTQAAWSSVKEPQDFSGAMRKEWRQRKGVESVVVTKKGKRSKIAAFDKYIGGGSENALSETGSPTRSSQSPVKKTPTSPDKNGTQKGRKRLVAKDNGRRPAKFMDSEKQFSPPKDFQLPPSDELLSLQLLTSSSGKINYVINKIKSEPDSHFLIYCDLDMVNYQLENVLSLAGISFLRALTGKADIIARFQNSTDIQVLLMTPQSGSKGLHITRANKIIFMSPLWRALDEYQASHRAARIGQKRETEVEILCMKDSFELRLYQRRKQIENDPDQAKRTAAWMQPAEADPILAQQLQQAAEESLFSENAHEQKGWTNFWENAEDTHLFQTMQIAALRLHGSVSNHPEPPSGLNSLEEDQLEEDQLEEDQLEEDELEEDAQEDFSPEANHSNRMFRSSKRGRRSTYNNGYSTGEENEEEDPEANPSKRVKFAL